MLKWTSYHIQWSEKRVRWESKLHPSIYDFSGINSSSYCWLIQFQMHVLNLYACTWEVWSYHKSPISSQCWSGRLTIFSDLRNVYDENQSCILRFTTSGWPFVDFKLFFFKLFQIKETDIYADQQITHKTLSYHLSTNCNLFSRNI
jgi:hypothetical protein